MSGSGKKAKKPVSKTRGRVAATKATGKRASAGRSRSGAPGTRRSTTSNAAGLSATLAGGAPETLPAKRRRAERLLTALHALYPVATCALRHADAFQLLVSTILSAQSTDETVNKVTPVLFTRYPTSRALADAPREDIERIIHSTGFFRQKAKSIQETARRIEGEFNGRVPDAIEELVTLPGVARKTANVVLGTWFGKNEGVVVDTHVGRLATRLGLTWTSKDTKDAVKIERDLMELVPRDQWTFLSHALIWHGRKVCPARKPNCAECALAGDCPSAGVYDA